MQLFDPDGGSIKTKRQSPLAERMRPEQLTDFIGQDHLLSPGKPLRHQIETDNLRSLILWGPPGTGKTTLATLIAKLTSSKFVPFSAVMSGIKEIKEVMVEAEKERMRGKRTILFVDEIHRFNRAQQDAFLPHVERGNIVLIGATTENPSFELNSALLSRSRVYVLEPLSAESIKILLQRALVDKEKGLGNEKVEIEENLLGQIAVAADGDARTAYNILEAVILGTPMNEKDERIVTQEIIKDILSGKTFLYDKSGEGHYNLISALHKSMRNSDCDASLYWLARMLEAGEDPMYIARRVVRFATEDIALADPRALQIAMDAMQAVQFIGMPEGKLALAQAVVYMAVAAKSNAIYVAYKKVQEDVKNTVNEPVPLQIRNAPTKLMENLDYGKGYKYAHDFAEGIADLECMPASLKNRKYYQPTERGLEKNIKDRMEQILKIKANMRKKNANDETKTK